jgi:hypothetical protein
VAEWGEGNEPYDTPSIEVEDTPNPVIAQLLGADGEPIFLIHERPFVAIGYSAHPKEPSRVVRLPA